MRRAPRWLQDPIMPGLALFVLIAVAGFTAMAVGWKVAARTLTVAHQVPALVSGGLAGLALVLIGAGLGTVHVSRRLAAEERVRTELVLDEAARLLDVIDGRPT